MSFNVKNRKIHHWAGFFAALPLLVIIGTGILLQLKKQVAWVQPPNELGPEGAWDAQAETVAETHENYQEIRIDPTVLDPVDALQPVEDDAAIRPLPERRLLHRRGGVGAGFALGGLGWPAHVLAAGCAVGVFVIFGWLTALYPVWSRVDAESEYAAARTGLAELFSLPEADKLAIENVNSPHFRGYTRMGGERTLGRVVERGTSTIAGSALRAWSSITCADSATASSAPTWNASG